jgi:hypothetical protein
LIIHWKQSWKLVVATFWQSVVNNMSKNRIRKRTPLKAMRAKLVSVIFSKMLAVDFDFLTLQDVNKIYIPVPEMRASLWLARKCFVGPVKN